MNLTLTVSMGVTARMASETPAPRPQSNLMQKDYFLLKLKISNTNSEQTILNILYREIS
jgi:hypothetical protein